MSGSSGLWVTDSAHPALLLQSQGKTREDVGNQIARGVALRFVRLNEGDRNHHYYDLAQVRGQQEMNGCCYRWFVPD